MNLKGLYGKADQLKNKLSQYRPLTQGETEAIRDEFIINFTYNSNAIEGSTLTLDETAIVLREGVTIGGRSVREHLEAVGHRDAYFYIEDLVKSKTPLSEKVIKDIHTLVLMDRREDKGVYRRLPVQITGSPAVLPQPYIVPKEMESLMERYNSEMQNLHPIERAATFHLLFESIHPFIDGNGRTGRLIMNLELMKEGYPPIDVKFNDRSLYIKAFNSWHKDNRPDEMIELVGNYAIKRLEEYIGLLEIANNHNPQSDGMSII